MLSLSELILPVHLGWGEPERARAQAVRFDLTVSFLKVPDGALSDELSGTICYAGLSEKISHCARLRPYRLIENLAYEVFQALSTEISKVSGAQLWIRVTKVSPPIEGLQGGASFELGQKG